MTEERWTGQEHRAAARLAQREIEECIDRRVSQRLVEHAAVEKTYRDELLGEVRALRELLTSAFPDGDPDGHRRAHEDAIDFFRDWGALMREIRNKTFVGLVWAGIVLVGLSVWSYVKAKIGAP
jgi:CHASE3 domain sensor protein